MSSRTSGASSCFDAGETKAVVVDRGELDREMAVAAADAGAELRLKAPVRRVDGDRVVTGGPGAGEVGFGVLIAADGPKGTVARSLGMARAPTHLAGVQADLVVDEPVETRLVEIHPNAAPEFFAWRIPVSDRVVRVGLCGETGVPALFRAYLARWPGQVVHHVTGTIPLGTMPRTYGHADPLRRGRGRPGQAHLGRRRLHGRPLGPVRGRDGRGLPRGRRLSRTRPSRRTRPGGRPTSGARSPSGTASSSPGGGSRPSEIDRLLRAFGNPKVVRAIVEYGDMDRPSGLLAKLVRMPALWPVLPIIMRLGIAEILAQDGGK